MPFGGYTPRTWSNVARLLNAAAAGDRQAADELLLLEYDELRKLAAARLAAERPGYSLLPTAVVDEAYLRLVVGQPAHDWNGRGHFFAAAEAMRRILVDNARRKQAAKHEIAVDRLWDYTRAWLRRELGFGGGT